MLRFLFLCALVLFALYGLIEARVFLGGPSVDITWPLPGSTATTSLVYILGESRPFSQLLLNSRPVSVSASTGRFQEPVLLVPGINRFQFSLRDKFSREQSFVYELVSN